MDNIATFMLGLEVVSTWLLLSASLGYFLLSLYLATDIFIYTYRMATASLPLSRWPRIKFSFRIALIVFFKWPSITREG